MSVQVALAPLIAYSDHERRKWREWITADPARNVVIVPATALLPSSEGGTAVYTVSNDNVAHQHKVTVGIRTEDQAQIVQGVDAGARVIVAGGLGLEDGAKVKIGEPGEAGDKDDDKKADEKGGGKKDAGKKDKDDDDKK